MGWGDSTIVHIHILKLQVTITMPVSASRWIAVLFLWMVGVQSRFVSSPRASLSKRAVNFDSSCDAHPEIKQGVADAASLAKNAASVLSDTDNPFVNGHPWDAVRQALFGNEQVSSTANVICEWNHPRQLDSQLISLFEAMYNNIASNPDVKVFCGEPSPQPNKDPGVDCSIYYSCAYVSRVVLGRYSCSQLFC